MDKETEVKVIQTRLASQDAEIADLRNELDEAHDLIRSLLAERTLYLLDHEYPIQELH